VHEALIKEHLGDLSMAIHFRINLATRFFRARKNAVTMNSERIASREECCQAYTPHGAWQSAVQHLTCPSGFVCGVAFAALPQDDFRRHISTLLHRR
jgi:hypothetical protein